MLTLLTLIAITSSATYPIILINLLKSNKKSDMLFRKTLRQAKLLQNMHGKMIRLAFHKSATK